MYRRFNLCQCTFDHVSTQFRPTIPINQIDEPINSSYWNRSRIGQYHRQVRHETTDARLRPSASTQQRSRFPASSVGSDTLLHCVNRKTIGTLRVTLHDAQHLSMSTTDQSISTYATRTGIRHQQHTPTYPPTHVTYTTRHLRPPTSVHPTSTSPCVYSPTYVTHLRPPPTSVRARLLVLWGQPETRLDTQSDHFGPALGLE